MLIYWTIKKYFQLLNLSEDVVEKFLPCINTNKVTGLDQISAKFLKKAANVLAYPFAKNLSVKLSVFLEEYKIAKLKPLFQKGSKTDSKTYRPISFLPVVSKVIEKSIHYQLEDYLKKMAYSTSISQVLEHVFQLIRN